MPIHIRAQPNQVAPYVLLPGDPNRAKHVAETFLENPVLYTQHRGMLGYTGTYKGLRISVQTTGMGCPSASIVAEELAMLGAKVLIRIGTCGGTSPKLAAADLIIAQAALSRDGTTYQYMQRKGISEGHHAPIASYRIIRAADDAAHTQGLPYQVGLICTDDAFYAVTPEEARALYESRGVLGIEMEAAAIFAVAQLRGMEAGCLVTNSNYVGDQTLVPDDVLQRGVDGMIQVALETCLLLEKQKKLQST